MCIRDSVSAVPMAARVSQKVGQSENPQNFLLMHAMADARWKRIVDLKLMQGKPALSPRGVVPESLFEDETHPLPAWDSLTKDQQTDLARRMSIFAAMVDVMDANIGRVVDELKKNGELDNTFCLLYTSQTLLISSSMIPLMALDPNCSLL